jgi:phosphoglucosamine mutase
MRVGLDCANGSAWAISKAVFDALGATVTLWGAEPNGTNINRGCGSTDVSALQTLVKERECDVGFAFDGDADRCICVNEKGEVVDGDGILYVSARFLKSGGELQNNAIAVTDMSNSGLVKSLAEEGIDCVRTRVGDRFVYEEMLKRGLMLGGEQSGHIIFRKYATTGDGILTAVKMAEILTESKCPLSCLTKGFRRFPQFTKNVRVRDKHAVLQTSCVLEAISSAQTALDGGRVFVRASGTEPVVRILVEGESAEKCRTAAEKIEGAIRSAEEGLCAGS